MILDKRDYTDKAHPVCPYCQSVTYIEHCGEDGAEHQITCWHCSEPYTAQLRVSPRWTSKKPPSDRTTIQDSTESYIMVRGRARGTAPWTLDTSTHFAIDFGRASIRCTHGGWKADLVYDSASRLTHLRITDQCYSGLDRDIVVAEFHLTNAHVEERQHHHFVLVGEV